MRISLNSIWLTNDGMTDLQSWTDAHDVILNGRQIVQDAQFFAGGVGAPFGARECGERPSVHGDSATHERGGGDGVCVDGVQFAAGERDGDGDLRGERGEFADVHVRGGVGGDAALQLPRDADGYDVCAARGGRSRPQRR